jgi:hypothetical protein
VTDAPVVSPEQIRRINDLLAAHGSAALDRLLDASHLFAGEMRQLSQLALRHSKDFADAELPHVLVVQLDPRAKLTASRVDVRLVTGRAQLALEVGTVSG